MRYIAAGIAIIAAATWVWFGADAPKQTSLEPERHYIRGFYPQRSARQFWDYIEPVTAEGLREVRWDHKPPRPTTSIGVSSSTSVIFTTAISGTLQMCNTVLPQVPIIGYTRH